MKNVLQVIHDILNEFLTNIALNQVDKETTLAYKLMQCVIKISYTYTVIKWNDLQLNGLKQSSLSNICLNTDLVWDLYYYLLILGYLIG